MFDSHVHTAFSTDSKMLLEEAIKSSSEQGLGIIITEHMDMNCTIPGAFRFDVKEYFDKYSTYRSSNLLLGIEIGLTEQFEEENRKLIESNSFDYVLGSIHFIDNYDIYYPDFYEGKNKREVYIEYLSTMLSNIKNNNFIDSLGHIDYICRYSPYEDKEIHYSDYRDYLDEILRELVSNNILMEINTRRLSDKRSIESLLQIYRRYKELGGIYVTIGSDAHYASAIGLNIGAAQSICDSTGLRPAIFQNRKLELVH